MPLVARVAERERRSPLLCRSERINSRHATSTRRRQSELDALPRLCRLSDTSAFASDSHRLASRKVDRRDATSAARARVCRCFRWASVPPRARTRPAVTMGGSLSKALGASASGISNELRRAQASSLATRRCASSCSGSMRRARRVRGPRCTGPCLSSRAAILYKLKLDQSVTTIPTVGLCVWSCGCRALIRQQRRDSDGSLNAA